ncbi:MAG: 30S ribosomal protein S6 [Armatimonadota bacterium]
MNTTKRLYESMYIIDANLTDDQVDSIIAKYAQLVTDQGGEVRSVGRWDKRRLAYEIKGRREGQYILMFFEAEAEVSKELDRVYRISDDVFRHLITRVEPEHVDTSRIEHPQPAAEEAAEAEATEEGAAAEEVQEVAEQPAQEQEEEAASVEIAEEQPQAEAAVEEEQPQAETE